MFSIDDEPDVTLAGLGNPVIWFPWVICGNASEIDRCKDDTEDGEVDTEIEDERGGQVDAEDVGV